MNTKDLRQALQAVLPHVAQDDSYGNLCNIRVAVTDENLFIQATSTVSAAMAIASVWEHDHLTGDPTVDVFELSPTTVKELLSIFKASKNQPDDSIGDALRITVTGKELRFLDVSGLFPGKEFSIPNGEVSPTYPNLTSLFYNALASDIVVPARIVTNGKLLQLFAHAAAAYAQPLAIEPTELKSRMLISCGESFLGLLMPIKAEEGSEIANDLLGWKAGWFNRLPDITDPSDSFIRQAARVYTYATSQSTPLESRTEEDDHDDD
ncbi:hypothetical protein [Arthrobacter sp. HLT1-20]